LVEIEKSKKEALDKIKSELNEKLAHTPKNNIVKPKNRH
jgi:hypothetical protein